MGQAAYQFSPSNITTSDSELEIDKFDTNSPQGANRQFIDFRLVQLYANFAVELEQDTLLSFEYTKDSKHETFYANFLTPLRVDLKLGKSVATLLVKSFTSTPPLQKIEYKASLQVNNKTHAVTLQQRPELLLEAGTKLALSFEVQNRHVGVVISEILQDFGVELSQKDMTLFQRISGTCHTIELYLLFPLRISSNVIQVSQVEIMFEPLLYRGYLLDKIEIISSVPIFTVRDQEMLQDEIRVLSPSSTSSDCNVTFRKPCSFIQLVTSRDSAAIHQKIVQAFGASHKKVPRLLASQLGSITVNGSISDKGFAPKSFSVLCTEPELPSYIQFNSVQFAGIRIAKDVEYSYKFDNKMVQIEVGHFALQMAHFGELICKEKNSQIKNWNNLFLKSGISCVTSHDILEQIKPISLETTAPVSEHVMFNLYDEMFIVDQNVADLSLKLRLELSLRTGRGIFTIVHKEEQILLPIRYAFPDFVFNLISDLEFCDIVINTTI